MTVQNQVVKNIYAGNGSTTVFPFTFEVNTAHPEYIIVYLTNTSGTTSPTTNYTLDMAAKTVTYPKSGTALATGEKLTIYRKLPYTQLLNLVNQGPFFAEDIESEYDDIVFMLQQLAEAFSRALTLDVSKDTSNFDLTVPFAADKAIKINSAGTGFALTDDPAQVLSKVNALFAQIQNELNTIAGANVEELTVLLNKTKSFEEAAKASALVNTRLIIASRDRTKTDYGLANANLVAVPTELIKLIEDSDDETR